MSQSQKSNLGTKFKRLKKPFSSKDLEWRVQSCGKSAGGKVWCKVIPYIQARAVMDRLDQVFGPENWEATYMPVQVDKKFGVQCTIMIALENNRHVSKSDVGVFSNTEELKGAYSDSLKRAAVHWGIGRYLYHTGEHFAQIVDKPGYSDPDRAYIKHAKTKDNQYFYWKEPILNFKEDDNEPEQTAEEPRSIIDDIKEIEQEKAKEVEAPLPNFATRVTENDIQNLKKVMDDMGWNKSQLSSLIKKTTNKPFAELKKNEIDFLKSIIVKNKPEVILSEQTL